MNTCIYLRKSRKGDDPNETPAETLRRHREQLLALAKKMDLCVTDIKEEIMSGDSIACRQMCIRDRAWTEKHKNAYSKNFIREILHTKPKATDWGWRWQSALSIFTREISP